MYFQLFFSFFSELLKSQVSHNALHSSCTSSPVGFVSLRRGGGQAETPRQLRRHRDQGRRRGRDAGRTQVPGGAGQVLLTSGKAKVTSCFPEFDSHSVEKIIFRVMSHSIDSKALLQGNQALV